MTVYLYSSYIHSCVVPPLGNPITLVTHGKSHSIANINRASKSTNPYNKGQHLSLLGANVVLFAVIGWPRTSL